MATLRDSSTDAGREAQRNALFENLPGMISVTNANGELEYCNRELLDLMGVEIADLVDLKWSSYLHPDDAAAAVAEWLRCSRAALPYRCYFRLRLKTGAYRWYESLVRPLFDQHGKVVNFYGLLNDIDDLRRADQERMNREGRLSALINSIPAMVWRSDADGRMNFINQRASEYAGLGPDDSPSSLLLRVHPDDQAASEAAWVEAVTTERPIAVSIRFKGFDGTYRWFEVRLQPVFDQRGALETWYGFAVDIDERVRLHEQAQANRAALERASRIATTAELSASIAHEINQPLAAINANSAACRQWLMTRPPNIERARIAVERIARDTEGVADVIARVKSLFKRGPLLRSWRDLDAIVTEACTLLTKELDGAGIRLTRIHARGLPLIWADHVQIQQLIINLIRNASDAIQAAGSVHRVITVETRHAAAGKLGLKVIDSGPGFGDPEKAFNAFYTTKTHGMGIGLAICRTIAEVHHGHLTASNDPALGTVLDLVLPPGQEGEVSTDHASAVGQ